MPLEDTQIEVDRLRQSLTSELFKLESHPGVVRLADTAGVELTNDNPADFDDLDAEPDGPEPDSHAESGRNEDVILPERRQIVLPSTHMLDNRSLCKEELRLRIKQATRYLSAIREGVAEKSFQYAHVMRMVASKAMETRSRGVIARINDRIAFGCRVYSRARAAMVRLGADNQVLHKFRLLSKEDVKASTEILKPNIPGSSNLRLSWIWQNGRSGSDLETMRECESKCSGSDSDLKSNTFNNAFQFNVYTGYVPDHRRIDGKKN